MERDNKDLYFHIWTGKYNLGSCKNYICCAMPYLVREHLFIGNISTAAEVLQNGSEEITHILSVLSSASISFFSEWRTGISIPTKEIKKVYVGGVEADEDEGDGSKSSVLSKKLLYLLEYAGKDLKLVRMAVPLRDMESENLLDYLDVCLDFIEESRKQGSVLVHCFAGVSRRYILKAGWSFVFWLVVCLFAVAYLLLFLCTLCYYVQF